MTSRRFTSTTLAETSTLSTHTTVNSSTPDLSPTVIEDTPSAISLLKMQPTHYVVASIAGRTLVLHPRDVLTIPRLNDVQIGDVLELDRIHEVGSRDYTLRAQDSMSTRSKGAAALMRRSVKSHELSLLERLRKVAIEEKVESPVLDAILNAHGEIKESQSWGARLKPSGLAHIGAVLNPGVVRVRCTVVEHTKGKMEYIVKKKRRKGYKRTIQHKQTYTRLRVEGIHFGDGQ
jgi:large subunit ribosomal protein L21